MTLLFFAFGLNNHPAFDYLDANLCQDRPNPPRFMAFTLLKIRDSIARYFSKVRLQFSIFLSFAAFFICVRIRTSRAKVFHFGIVCLTVLYSCEQNRAEHYFILHLAYLVLQ